MAEPSKCPYCRTGIPLWIWHEETNVYTLQCSHCEASGNYQAAQQGVQSDGLYWCWNCNLWQKFDHDNRCGVCKTARR